MTYALKKYQMHQNVYILNFWIMIEHREKYS
jgi:hypothetical protein